MDKTPANAGLDLTGMCRMVRYTSSKEGSWVVASNYLDLVVHQCLQVSVGISHDVIGDVKRQPSDNSENRSR